MMSKTHLSVGIAASLVAIRPRSTLECALAVAAGAVGSVIADVDTVKHDYQSDALTGQIFAALLLCMCFGVDYFLHLGMIAYIVEHKMVSFVGIGCYTILYIIGLLSPHRTFTHSILAMGLFAISAAMVYPGFMNGFLCGYLSHIALDLLNKKPVPVFYPFGRGFCLHVCYASKLGNTIGLILGLFAAAVMLVVSIMRIL